MAPQAEPIVTVGEIDEALWWVVISCPRDAHYGRIVDALLDQRSRVKRAEHSQPHHREDQGAHQEGCLDQSADHPCAR